MTGELHSHVEHKSGKKRMAATLYLEVTRPGELSHMEYKSGRNAWTLSLYPEVTMTRKLFTWDTRAEKRRA